MDLDSIYSLIESFGDGSIIFTIDKKKKCITIKDKNNLNRGDFTLKIGVTSHNIKFKPYDNKNVNDKHLSDIINDRHKLVSDQHIIEVIDTIKDIIPNIYNYCVGCLKKTEFQGDTFITCGSSACDYKFEELRIGNPVIEKTKEDQEIARFLIESAFDAIQCQRKYDIFEPFPKHFLKPGYDINTSRGEMSKITGKNYDTYKDFDRLDKIVKKFNIDKFFELLEYCKDDNEIIKIVKEDTYTLIRFILMSCKVQIVKEVSLLKNGPKTCYKIVHPTYKEEEFEKLKKDQFSGAYLFHGSRWHNWYSILRNGLKNCSKTQLMTAGAAYGNGIYLSDSFDFCCGYGLSNNRYVVGVFEVLGSKNDYRKGGSVFVVADDKKLIQKYLLIIPTSKKSSVGSEISTLFGTELKREEAKVKTLVITKGIKRLIREYKRISKLDLKKLGFKINVDNKDLYLWKVFITEFEKGLPITNDMERFGIKEIEFEMKFPQNFPMSPPFIRIIKPRFQHLTGHVTQAGALCMQILTDKYWSPACSLESLIVTIKSEIMEGDGRLDPSKYHIPYGEKEARESFHRVSMGHGWE